MALLALLEIRMEAKLESQDMRFPDNSRGAGEEATENDPACESRVLTKPDWMQPFAADCISEFSCRCLRTSISTEAIVCAAQVRHTDSDIMLEVSDLKCHE